LINFEDEIKTAIEIARPKVRNILSGFPNDVEDVLQNASLQAWRKLYKFEGKSRFSTWFYKIAENQALMFLRKQKTRLLLPIEEIQNIQKFEFNPEKLAFRKEIKQKAVNLILKLAPKQRKEVLLWTIGESIGSENRGSRKANRFRGIHNLKDRFQEVL
jgi:RNA polymerase sigma factor (sigma-70 family)